MIPSHNIVWLIIVPRSAQIFDHILIGFVLGVHSGFCSLDWQAKSVRDDEGVSLNRALHQTHDFDAAARPCMHDHFEQSDGGNSYVFEVVGVFLPWFGLINGLLLFGGVAVEGIAGGIEQFDRVFELWEIY